MSNICLLYDVYTPVYKFPFALCMNRSDSLIYVEVSTVMNVLYKKEDTKVFGM